MWSTSVEGTSPQTLHTGSRWRMPRRSLSQPLGNLWRLVLPAQGFKVCWGQGLGLGQVGWLQALEALTIGAVVID